MKPYQGFAQFLPLIVGIVGAIITALILTHFKTIDLAAVTAGSVGSVLLGLVFFALVIERATEVYVNVRFGPAQSRMATEIETAAKSGEPVTEGETPAEKLDGLKIRTKQEASLLAMIFGVMMAVAGVRTIAPFIPVKPVAAAAQAVESGASEVADKMAAFLDPGQLELFAGVDVLLTAALLAGGADGIHQILRRVLSSGK